MRQVDPCVAYRQHVFIGHDHVSLGIQTCQNNPDRSIATAQIEDQAGGVRLQEAQKHIRALVDIERRKERMRHVKGEAVAAMLIGDLLFKVNIHTHTRGQQGRD